MNSEKSKACEYQPCPFCGSSYLIEYTCDGEVESIECDNNCCHGVDPETWNHRPVEDKLDQRITELETENKQLREELGRRWDGRDM